MEIYYKDIHKWKDYRKFTVWLCSSGEGDESLIPRAMAIVYKPGTNIARMHLEEANDFDYKSIKVEMSDLIFDKELRWKLKKAAQLHFEESPKYRPKMILRANKLLEIIKKIEGVEE